MYIKKCLKSIAVVTVFLFSVTTVATSAPHLPTFLQKNYLGPFLTANTSEEHTSEVSAALESPTGIAESGTVAAAKVSHQGSKNRDVELREELKRAQNIIKQGTKEAALKVEGILEDWMPYVRKRGAALDGWIFFAFLNLNHALDLILDKVDEAAIEWEKTLAKIGRGVYKLDLGRSFAHAYMAYIVAKHYFDRGNFEKAKHYIKYSYSVLERKKQLKTMAGVRPNLEQLVASLNIIQTSMNLRKWQTALSLDKLEENEKELVASVEILKNKKGREPKELRVVGIYDLGWIAYYRTYFEAEPEKKDAALKQAETYLEAAQTEAGMSSQQSFLLEGAIAIRKGEYQKAEQLYDTYLREDAGKRKNQVNERKARMGHLQALLYQKDEGAMQMIDKLQSSPVHQNYYRGLLRFIEAEAAYPADKQAGSSEYRAAMKNWDPLLRGDQIAALARTDVHLPFYQNLFRGKIRASPSQTATPLTDFDEAFSFLEHLMKEKIPLDFLVPVVLETFELPDTYEQFVHFFENKKLHTKIHKIMVDFAEKIQQGLVTQVQSQENPAMQQAEEKLSSFVAKHRRKGLVEKGRKESERQRQEEESRERVIERWKSLFREDRREAIQMKPLKEILRLMHLKLTPEEEAQFTSDVTPHFLRFLDRSHGPQMVSAYLDEVEFIIGKDVSPEYLVRFKEGFSKWPIQYMKELDQVRQNIPKILSRLFILFNRLQQLVIQPSLKGIESEVSTLLELVKEKTDDGNVELTNMYGDSQNRFNTIQKEFHKELENLLEETQKAFNSLFPEAFRRQRGLSEELLQTNGTLEKKRARLFTEIEKNLNEIREKLGVKEEEIPAKISKKIPFLLIPKKSPFFVPSVFRSNEKSIVREIKKFLENPDHKRYYVGKRRAEKPLEALNEIFITLPGKRNYRLWVRRFEKKGLTEGLILLTFDRAERIRRGGGGNLEEDAMKYLTRIVRETEDAQKILQNHEKYEHLNELGSLVFQELEKNNTVLDEAFARAA